MDIGEIVENILQPYGFKGNQKRRDFRKIYDSVCQRIQIQRSSYSEAYMFNFMILDTVYSKTISKPSQPVMSVRPVEIGVKLGLDLHSIVRREKSLDFTLTFADCKRVEDAAYLLRLGLDGFFSEVQSVSDLKTILASDWGRSMLFSRDYLRYINVS